MVAGMHNSETQICPFRYEFLRAMLVFKKNVKVVGTNADLEGTCQKEGEGLDTHNNGYHIGDIDDLLDYIKSDLQYLYNPVDYIFTSMGMHDCLTWKKGRDFQILSQSTRRTMGRLLNLNEKAKIIHIPILLPQSAGDLAWECMNFVTAKLREVYDKNTKGRILILKDVDKDLKEDMFSIVGNRPVPDSEKTETADHPKKVKKQKPEKELQATEKEEVKFDTEPKEEELPTKIKSAENEPIESTEKEGEKSTDNKAKKVEKIKPLEAERRRGSELYLYLPKTQLTITIANSLLKTVEFEFRAITPTPTMDVTKEADYYGYEWCVKNFEEEECFEYYYGYVWCLKQYKDEDCYNYYYGEQEWETNSTLKWCLNFYDEEYCSFAYKGEEPDTWDWLSFGYHDCLKSKKSEECFDEYYGYAWCLKEYSDASSCYEYYYGADYFEWNPETTYKWCLNFYTADDCHTKYGVGESGDAGNGITSKLVASSSFFSSNPVVTGGAFAVLAFIVVWWCSNKCSSKSERVYSRLNTNFAEDEVGLL